MDLNLQLNVHSLPSDSCTDDEISGEYSYIIYADGMGPLD